MEYKELIERLNEWHENLISEMCADDVFTCDDLCGCTGDCIVVQASTAIKDLISRAEAEEARAEKAERERDELQREMLVCRNGWKNAEMERDAAVKDIDILAEHFYFEANGKNPCIICDNQKKDCTFCDGTLGFRWRGVKGE